jgi:hypothetical protein
MFDEEQQRQKHRHVQFILPLTHQGDLLDFFILRRVDECQEPFTKTPILQQLLEIYNFIPFSTRGRQLFLVFLIIVTNVNIGIVLLQSSLLSSDFLRCF